MGLIYLYDGSFDGFLSSVFDAYATKRAPDQITEEENLQIAFAQELYSVQTDEQKARRVEAGIVKKLGKTAYQKVWKAFLSTHPDKSTILYRYIRHGFLVGRRIHDDLTHTDVLPADKLYDLVCRESYRMLEFLRFSEMEGGVFYAKISPDHAVMPLIMPHFVDRYCVQPFLIYDDVHAVAGVYDGEGWYMVETKEMTIPDITVHELQFRRMWKQFYQTIAIKERNNPRCRRSFMPGKYWHNMTEFNFIETRKTAQMDQKNTQGTRKISVEN